MYLCKQADKMKTTRQSKLPQRLKKDHPRSKQKHNGGKLAMAVMMLPATTAKPNQAFFDTDSAPVGVDNRFSGCISHQIADFIGYLVDCNRIIKGFGGTRTTNIKMGTIK